MALILLFEVDLILGEYCEMKYTFPEAVCFMNAELFEVETVETFIARVANLAVLAS